MNERFADRSDAGRQLAEGLIRYAGRPDVVVLGLPRGGVPVAYEVAQALKVPMEAFVVRKLGVPGHEELAMGAIASGGARVLNREVLVAGRLTPEDVERVATRELERLERQEKIYRGSRPPRQVAGTTVILVDDGLATGATMRAAIQALRSGGVARIVVAVPVAPRQTCDALDNEVHEVVCPCRPDPFTAVGLWYRDFSPVTDEEVRQLLSTQASSGTSR
jgi:predicted phosphoribosyltransferase